MDRSDWTVLGIALLVVGVSHALAVALFVQRGLRELPRRRLVRGLLAAYGVLTASGLGIGLAITAGPEGRRLTGGAIGIAMAWLAAWFVAFVLLLSRATWKAVHYMRDAVPIPPPRPSRGSSEDLRHP